MFKYKKLLLVICFVTFYNISFGSSYLFLKIVFKNFNPIDQEEALVIDSHNNPYPNSFSNIYTTVQNTDFILIPSSQLPPNGYIYINGIPSAIEDSKYPLGVIKITDGYFSLIQGFSVNAVKICLVLNADAEEVVISNIYGSGPGPGPTPPPPPFGECLIR